MHWYNYLTLAAGSVAAGGQLWERRWLLAAAFASMVAYQVFGKWFPAVLPAGVPELFGVAGLCLAVLETVRVRRRKAQSEAGAR